MNPYLRLVILLSATMLQCIPGFLIFTLTVTKKKFIAYSLSSCNVLCVIIVLFFTAAALRDHRIELVRASSQELTIRINDVSLSDEGQYTCSLFTMPVKTTKAFLTVLGDIVGFAHECVHICHINLSNPLLRSGRKWLWSNCIWNYRSSSTARNHRLHQARHRGGHHHADLRDDRQQTSCQDPVAPEWQGSPR